MKEAVSEIPSRGRVGPPLVTTIIPVFNGAAFLGAAIESVISQSYRPIEIIVVDDGSTDDSRHVAESFDGVRCISQRNAGPSAARNAGIKEATGSILAFLDSDDEWLPGKIARQVHYLLEHEDVGCVFVCERIVIETHKRPPWIDDKWLTAGRRAINVSSLATRKATLAHVGLFNPDIRSGEDTDWVLRARDAGVRMELISDVHVLRRLHESNSALNEPPDHSAFLRVLRASIHRQRRARTAGEGS